MPSSPAARFRQGAGRISLDLLRTRRQQGDQTTEELPDRAAVTAWFAQFAGAAGIEHDGADVGPGVPELVRAVREAIRSLVSAARSDGGVASCPTPDREMVNAAAAHPVFAPGLDADGRIRWVSDQPVTAFMSVVARDALDLVAAPATAHRVRRCANPECGALFIDQSGPGRRRWCSMATCGNRAKKIGLRDRRRSTG